MGWNENTKVAVFGAGSIGCYVGGHLQAAGVPVTYIGRDRFAQMLKEHGLTLTHFERDPVTLPPDSYDFHTQPRHISDADIILITVKSQDTEAAGKALAWHAKKDALIISFQNGVTNADELRAHLPEHNVLSGVVPFNVTLAAPGVFHSGTQGELIIENTADPRLAGLIERLNQTGLPAKAHDNITGVMWGKLLINLNNALNTLHGDTLLTGLTQRDYRKAFAASLEEGLQVCRKANINPESFAAPFETTIRTLRLPNLLYKPIMRKMIKIDASARSSMLDDLELGRPPEIDYLQGAIVRLAEETNQSAPVNAAVLAATNAAFKVGKSPKYTGTQILNLVR